MFVHFIAHRSPATLGCGYFNLWDWAPWTGLEVISVKLLSKSSIEKFWFHPSNMSKVSKIKTSMLFIGLQKFLSPHNIGWLHFYDFGSLAHSVVQ